MREVSFLEEKLGDEMISPSSADEAHFLPGAERNVTIVGASMADGPSAIGSVTVEEAVVHSKSSPSTSADPGMDSDASTEY